MGLTAQLPLRGPTPAASAAASGQAPRIWSPLRWRLPARSTVSMALLAIAMHGALLALWQHLPRASSGGKPPGAIQVRLLTPAAPNRETSAGAASAAAPAEPVTMSHATPASIEAQAVARADLANAVPDQPASSHIVAAPAVSGTADSDKGDWQPASRQAASGSVPPQPAAAQAKSSQPLLQRASNEWAYLPASQLDVRPAAQGDIILPFPEGETLARGKRVSAVLLLYVSAEGAVDRIEFAQSALPPAFERTAVDAFSHVRLRPGMKDGKPHRARMKIEVEFEAPLPSREPASRLVVESSRSWQDAQ